MPTKRAGRIYFYPRPPRGGRHKTGELALWDDEFLSTPSARRATMSWPLMPLARLYFYPRPPRGGRRAKAKNANSIH